MYVARYTHNPEEDIKRGWSGWMGQNWPTREAALSELVEMPGDDEMDERQQRWIRTWGEMYEDRAKFVEDLRDDLAERQGIDLRYDEFYHEWRRVHHDGLSCFCLDAETAEAAIAEARDLDASKQIHWWGDGDYTHGAVTLVGHVGGDLYVFECDYASCEV